MFEYDFKIILSLWSKDRPCSSFVGSVTKTCHLLRKIMEFKGRKHQSWLCLLPEASFVVFVYKKYLFVLYLLTLLWQKHFPSHQHEINRFWISILLCKDNYFDLATFAEVFALLFFAAEIGAAFFLDFLIHLSYSLTFETINCIPSTNPKRSNWMLFWTLRKYLVCVLFVVSEEGRCMKGGAFGSFYNYKSFS